MSKERTIKVDDVILDALRSLEGWLRGYRAAMRPDDRTGPPWDGFVALEHVRLSGLHPGHGTYIEPPGRSFRRTSPVSPHS